MKRAAAIILLLAACRDSKSAPDAGPKPIDPALAASAASFRYKSSFRITPPTDWNPRADRELTLARCEQTAWSYAGCEEVFPKEGRAWLREDCAKGMSAVVCTRFAEYQLKGVGGPGEEEQGMTSLTRWCDFNHRVACGEIAEHLAPKDKERARVFFYRACKDYDDAPMGMCANLDALLAPQ